MTRFNAWSRAVGAVIVVAASACGHKGPVVPPARPVPSAATAFAIERAGTAVTLQFVIPDTNLDGSTPPAVDRMEIFGLSKPADDPKPTSAELMAQTHLVTSLTVRPSEVAADAKPDSRPAPGDAASFVETVPAPAEGVSLVRYYLVVPAAGRRRGPLSPILRVPLSTSPAPPAEFTIDYDERTLTAVWRSAAPGQRFVVDETDSAGAHGKRITSSPLDAPTMARPVKFGQPICLTVQAVLSQDAVSVLGAPTAPVCVTPTDHFPPPAPSGLIANAGEGGVDLAWMAVSAADLAGYVVLRGENPNGTLQPLMSAPVTGTTYRDQTARPGVTYVYAVVAIDSVTPPNRSPESNRQMVTAKQPAPRVHKEG